MMISQNNEIVSIINLFLKKHFRDECLRTPTKCQNEGCDEVLPRNEVILIIARQTITITRSEIHSGSAEYWELLFNGI